MSIYLHDIPLPEAWARFEAALKSAGRWGILAPEEIPLDEHCAGRVLAEPVWAKISSPHYHAAAMDGFIVRSADTETAMPNAPVVLECPMQASYVDTGDPIPVWADAVIPIEIIEALDGMGGLALSPRAPAAVRIRNAVAPWSHIRPLGEDIVATQLVLPAGHILRPVDLGAIAACGHSSVCIVMRPRVAILPTGNELIPIGEAAHAGDIIEFNSLVLAAQVDQWGGCATRYSIIPDQFEAIQQQVSLAARESDLILLNAGSSAGSEDFSAQVIESLGEMLVHGVAIRPGHPVIIGMIRAESSSVPIIGVPGYPVSAAMTGEIFVEPLLARWLGRPPVEPMTISAKMTRKVASPAGDDDYLRVTVGKVNEKVLAAPLPRGAGVISSLVRADGIAIIPRGSQGVEAGDEVSVRLYRSLKDMEQTIFAIGSHDITLDILAQFLAGRNRRLASANVGSLGGLIALKRGEAHLAGSHLLDTLTGEYNLSYIQEYLADVPVKVVALVGRTQGLMVQKGNPKQINTLGDLTRPEITYINRQRGAGTRVLLDYRLNQNGIDPRQIRGYAQEEYTHLTVAAAIASGRVDCGLGIAAAAQGLGLDFIPLYQERYDLVIPDDYYESDLLAPLLDLLKDINFKHMVAALPGYNIEVMGKIIQ